MNYKGRDIQVKKFLDTHKKLWANKIFHKKRYCLMKELESEMKLLVEQAYQENIFSRKTSIVDAATGLLKRMK